MPTVTQSASVAPKPGPWSDTVSLPQIDPAQIVDTITLALTGTVDSSVAALNLEGTPAAFSSTTQGTVTLEHPDGSTWLLANPAAVLSATLPPGAPSDVWLLGATSLSGEGSSTASATYGPEPGFRKRRLAAPRERHDHAAPHRVGPHPRRRSRQPAGAFRGRALDRRPADGLVHLRPGRDRRHRSGAATSRTHPDARPASGRRHPNHGSERRRLP
ncbi:MAG: choice-of-anchor E domain-containing protein [Acetobacteraceae bacterium]|nr:choice-of-anchor E domain-containing protein [Acetobacteraceae bacterium]